MCNQVSENSREMLLFISELSRVVRCCQKEAVFCENVTFTQFLILDRISEGGALKLAALHEILSVDKSTTTRLVQPLIREGLVIRERSNRDSRAVNLRLTENGELVRRKAWACVAKFVKGIHMGIPEGKRTEVYEAVRIFLNAMRNACDGGMCPV